MSEVVHLFRALPPRDCEGCGDGHCEPGLLCRECRTRMAAVAPAFIASTTEGVIADLERLDSSRFPMADPIAEVLRKTRRLYDLVGPRIQGAAPGEIHFFSGEFWAFPADADGVQIGPFPNADSASTALVEFAANKSVKP